MYVYLHAGLKAILGLNQVKQIFSLVIYSVFTEVVLVLEKFTFIDRISISN